MELIFATHNKNKLIEVQALMPKHIKLLSLDDIGCREEIPETAQTIEGNAALKAAYVKAHYGYDCFADDTGLQVEAIAGAPGVHSARYAGEPCNDEANIRKLLHHMEEKENRNARFITVIALNLEESENFFTGICKGSITKEKRGEKGFGYDPVFKPEGQNLTFAEMDLKQKSALSHRGQALRALISYLSK